MNMNPLNFLPRLAAVLLGCACLVAHADLVTDWNTRALDAIRAARPPPPLAARSLAILHVAIYDACNGIGQNGEPYHVTGKPAGVASKEAAVATAARRVLVNLFPAGQAGFEAAWTAELAALADGPAKNMGMAWGEQVALAILQLRADDGANLPAGYAPGSGAGVWVPTPPAFAPALLPNFATVTPFVLTHPAQFRPPPPPALDRVEWAEDCNLTKDLGRSDSATRTTEQTVIARFWADGAGTATPPGHWNIIARDVAFQRGNTLDENARLFALLNLAEADAGIMAWDCKFAYNFWRPVTAIHLADIDGNADTTPDAGWSPLLVTPPFPEYVSGHSTFSGAAATVLAGFFGANDIAFTTAAEDPPGEVRAFASFSAAAEEAGLRCGRAVGHHVTGNFLLPHPGRSHRGH